jgi:hypothetical protein
VIIVTKALSFDKVLSVILSHLLSKQATDEEMTPRKVQQLVAGRGGFHGVSRILLPKWVAESYLERAELEGAVARCDTVFGPRFYANRFDSWDVKGGCWKVGAAPAPRARR